MNQNYLGDDWSACVHAQSKQRLFLAAYILRSRLATFLAFCDDNSWFLDVIVPLPVATVTWNVEPMSNRDLPWVQQYSPVCVQQILDNLISQEPLDAFQSLLLVAILGARENAHHTTPVRLKTAFLSRILDPHPSVQMFYHATLLTSKTSLRSLLAVSGESWILSQR